MPTFARTRSSRSLWPRAVSTAVLLSSLAGLAACGSGASAAKGSPITIAVLDDPTRHMAFWALEHGKVDLGGVKVKVVYVPTQTAQQAYQSRQYDIVETSPVAVPIADTKGLKTKILTAGIQDRDATVVDVPTDSGIRNPEGLRGRTVAISAPTGSSTIELQYVLQKGHGLRSGEQGGDVKLQVTPPDATLSLMKQGALQAAVELNLPRYRAEHQGGSRAVLHVSEEAGKELGAAPVQTVLVTYPNLETSRAGDLAKVVKVLQQSSTYARDHKAAVAQAVANGNTGEAAYLSWWWSTSDLRFGSLTSNDAAGISGFWTMAHTLGRLTTVPRFQSFRSSAAPSS